MKLKICFFIIMLCVCSSAHTQITFFVWDEDKKPVPCKVYFQNDRNEEHRIGETDANGLFTNSEHCSDGSNIRIEPLEPDVYFRIPAIACSEIQNRYIEVRHLTRSKIEVANFKTIALTITNQDDNLLPSKSRSIADVNLMNKIFDNYKFDIVHAEGLNADSIDYFFGKIERYDQAVIYFSGYGRVIDDKIYISSLSNPKEDNVSINSIIQKLIKTAGSSPINIVIIIDLYTNGNAYLNEQSFKKAEGILDKIRGSIGNIELHLSDLDTYTKTKPEYAEGMLAHAYWELEVSLRPTDYLPLVSVVFLLIVG